MNCKFSIDVESYVQKIILSCGFESTLVMGNAEDAIAEGLRALGANASSFALKSYDKEDYLRTPFASEEFSSIALIGCLEQFGDAAVDQSLNEIKRICSRFVFLAVSRPVLEKNRAWWETKCFEAGFRKHFLYYRFNRYEALENEGEWILILLEKIPEDANARYPLSAIKEERGLYMDMLRETGSRSDAHVDRYVWASKFVRQGDTVIDAACGLGYGSYLLSATTRAVKFIGIDGSNYAATYARLNFDAGGRTEFHEGYLPQRLSNFADSSIDTIISFDTLEHVEEPTELLNEFHRILTPGGRLICSVPNDWSDETGQDPNPYHLHVYTRQKLCVQLGHLFDIEHLVGQTANRVKKAGAICEWATRPRQYIDIPEESSAPFEAEWLLAVAAKAPYTSPPVPYVETAFTQGEIDAAKNALAFGRDYENPWLVRSIVSIGLRTENPSIREKWARIALQESSKSSADYGAAICVLAYLEYERAVKIHNSTVFPIAKEYVENSETINPNVLRWKVSLTYVLAIWSMKEGNTLAAKEFFKQVLALPADLYSATLLTKPAEAGYFLGTLYLSEGDSESALNVWTRTFNDIKISLTKALSAIDSPNRPSFELPEITVALSILGKIVEAIRNCPNASFRPGVYHDALEANLLAQSRNSQAMYKLLARNNAEFNKLQEHAGELSKGKEWLEEQWRNLSDLTERQTLELQQNTATYENELSMYKKRLDDQTNELSKIKNGFLFRVLSRLGLL